MKRHLKLKEIIWEVTGRCENGCSYCGSKAMWKVEIDEARIIKIAEAIAKYPPEEIDISGGDPLLVSRETHRKIVDILKKVNVKCKILFNPKSMSNDKLEQSTKAHSILAMYDWIGSSVNTDEECGLFEDCIHGTWKNKVTIISNFNLQNIFSFDKIKELVKKHKTGWQVQYTMYDDPTSTLALYKTKEHDNPSARGFLFNKIEEAMREGINIILADNLNCGSCGAGLCSLGILSSGAVIPCLSMRSWWHDIGALTQDNILGCDLEMIWEKQFKKQRFGDFICCKDYCNNSCFKPNLPYAITEAPPPPEGWTIVRPNDWDDKQVLYGVVQPHITVYAVQTPPHVVAYAVQPSYVPDQVFVYGCPSTTTSTYPGKKMMYGVWSQASADDKKK